MTVSDGPDDPNIADDELLWRRIRPEWIDDKDGTLTSQAFLDRLSGTPSVNRANLTNREAVLRDYQSMGLAEVEARVPRANEHGVLSDPTPDPSHALLVPAPSLTSGEKRKQAARRIAKAARIVVPVPRT